MAVIRCKMCGGDLVIKPDSTVAECEYCGTVQTVPTVDNEKKLTLFNRAHRLRYLCEFDKAAVVYEQIVAEFPEEAESYWGLVLCTYGIEYVDDPREGKKVPTCHRSAYSSVLENKDFTMAMEYADPASRKLYRQEAKQIEQLRRDIIAVSGQEAPYDIFICYKETDEDGNRTMDSVLAQDLYKALTEAGFRVFFSRISLEEKLGREYEPYIFAALNSAQVMLVVGTDYERFHAVWVKNEWSRFLKLMEQDKQKHLIPCYRDIDAYDMPSEFARLQAQDLGKVGAIQDLLRGIEKLMPQEKQVTVIQERVLVSEHANVTPLLRRAALFLEDKDWESADKYCEKVLDLDPENAGAYFCKLMAEYRISREADLQSIDPACLQSANYGKALRFGDSAMQEKLDNIRKDMVYHAAKKLTIQKGSRQQKENLREAISRLETIPHWRDSDQLIETYRQEMESILQKEETARQEKQRKREKQAENRKKKASASNLTKLIVILLCGVILLEILVFAGLVPKMFDKREPTAQTEVTKTTQASVVFEEETQTPTEALSEEEIQYQQAEIWEADGQLGRAAIAFGKLGDYEDARQRSFAIWERITPHGTIADFVTTAEDLKNEGKLDTYRNYDLTEWKDIVDHLEINSEYWIPNSQNGWKNEWDDYVIGLRSDGTVVAAGDNFGGQCDVSDWTDIVAITSDRHGSKFDRNGTGSNCYTVGLKFDGSLVTAGKTPENWNLTEWTDIVKISTSGEYMAGVRSDGTVVSTHYDVSGWKDIIDVDVGKYHVIGLRADGTVAAVGNNYLYHHLEVDNWTDIVAISASDWHTVGLKSDGTAVAVGYNNGDQCEVSVWTDIVAIETAKWRTVGLKKDGTFVDSVHPQKQYNSSYFSKIRLSKRTLPARNGNETEKEGIPLDQQSQYDAAEKLLASGETAKAAIAFGKLGGYKDARERSFELWEKVTQRDTISAELNHTVAVKNDGTVLATGDNHDGQCNVENWSDIIAISTGSYHTVGLKADGTVVATGSNENGQCDVTDWQDIVSVHANGDNTVGLRSDGTVVVNGWNQKYYDISDWENIIAVDIGFYVVGLREDGTVITTGGYPAQRDVVESWTGISAIRAHQGVTIGIKADGTVLSALVKKNDQKELDTWTDIIDVDFFDGRVGVRSDGTVATAGSLVSKDIIGKWTDIVSITQGYGYTIGLKSDGTVVSAGNNKAGRCNVSDWTDIRIPNKTIVVD